MLLIASEDQLIPASLSNQFRIEPFPTRCHERQLRNRLPESLSICHHSPPASFSGTKNVTATGNILACGLANLALIASVSRSISPGISCALARMAFLFRSNWSRSGSSNKQLLNVVGFVQFRFDGLLQFGQDRRDVFGFLLGSLGQPLLQAADPILHACFESRGQRGRQASGKAPAASPSRMTTVPDPFPPPAPNRSAPRSDDRPTCLP